MINVKDLILKNRILGFPGNKSRYRICKFDRDPDGNLAKIIFSIWRFRRGVEHVKAAGRPVGFELQEGGKKKYVEVF